MCPRLELFKLDSGKADKIECPRLDMDHADVVPYLDLYHNSLHPLGMERFVNCPCQRVGKDQKEDRADVDFHTCLLWKRGL